MKTTFTFLMLFGCFLQGKGFFFNLEDESDTTTEQNENFNTLATPSLLDDLEEPNSCQIDGEPAGFKLYTRYARNEGECVRFDDASMGSSYFNRSHRALFFIHGYMGSGDDWYVNDLKNTLIDKERLNVFIVDWSVGSWQLPIFALMQTEDVAQTVTAFIRNLTRAYTLNVKDLHVIGHSLGARVAGKVGESLDPKLGRITVLDPLPGDYRGVADFVDVIHATFLSDWARGDAQFFPNNGRMSGRVPWGSAHIGAIYLYQHSVMGGCDFKAYQCESYEQYINHECDFHGFNYLGHHASPKLARGKLFLTLKNEPPFCEPISGQPSSDQS